MDGFDDFVDGTVVENGNQAGELDMLGEQPDAYMMGSEEPDMFGGATDVPDAFAAPVATADSFSAPPAQLAQPPATPAGPERVDARVAWRAKNAEVLKKRDADELEASKKVQAAAQEYLKDFYEKRASHVERAKKENRDVEEAAKFKPTGDTAWERVISLIDFKFDSGRQKEVDRDRFKNLLFTAKERNVPVRPPHALEAAK